jgi:hypothetical protein
VPCWRSPRRVAVSAVRDATIAVTKQRAGAALRAMITDGHLLTVSKAA